VLKDRLYTKAARSKSRRSAQTAVWKITSALVRLAAPILVFTSEEIWKYLPKPSGYPESVHMTVFPNAAEFETGMTAKQREEWNQILLVREEALKALEVARNEKKISSSLEARVILHASYSLADLLEKYAGILAAVLIVSQVQLGGLMEPPIFTPVTIPGFQVSVVRALGKKCERCWNYSTHVGENKRYPTVCERCSEALGEIESDSSASVAVT